jgi:hypothetical protein
MYVSKSTPRRAVNFVSGIVMRFVSLPRRKGAKRYIKGLIALTSGPDYPRVSQLLSSTRLFAIEDSMTRRVGCISVTAAQQTIAVHVLSLTQAHYERGGVARAMSLFVQSLYPTAVRLHITMHDKYTQLAMDFSGAVISTSADNTPSRPDRAVVLEQQLGRSGQQPEDVSRASRASRATRPLTPHALGPTAPGFLESLRANYALPRRTLVQLRPNLPL